MAKAGYEGSSQDHFYTNSGLHRIVTRHLRCICEPCLKDPKLFSTDCRLKEWCGDVRHYNLEGDTTVGRVDARPNRDILTVTQFATTLGTAGEPCERVVVCIVHEDDQNELDEPFYLVEVGCVKCIQAHMHVCTHSHTCMNSFTCAFPHTSFTHTCSLAHTHMTGKHCTHTCLITT